jgi:hypothetical protein
MQPALHKCIAVRKSRWKGKRTTWLILLRMERIQEQDFSMMSLNYCCTSVSRLKIIYECVIDFGKKGARSRGFLGNMREARFCVLINYLSLSS